jgi:hypothetical protein
MAKSKAEKLLGERPTMPPPPMPPTGGTTPVIGHNRGPPLETSETIPITGSIPEAGRIFFGVSREASYRLAQKGIIPTLNTGSRNKVALMRKLARQLGADPQDDSAA